MHIDISAVRNCYRHRLGLIAVGRDGRGVTQEPGCAGSQETGKNQPFHIGIHGVLENCAGIKSRQSGRGAGSDLIFWKRLKSSGLKIPETYLQ